MNWQDKPSSKSTLSTFSLKLLSFVASRANTGCALREVYEAFPLADQKIVVGRLNNMLRGGYVARSEPGVRGVWRVTAECSVPEGLTLVASEQVDKALVEVAAKGESGDVDGDDGDDDDEAEEVASPNGVVVIPRAPASVFSLGLSIDASEERDFDAEADLAGSAKASSRLAVGAAWPFPRPGTDTASAASAAPAPAPAPLGWVAPTLTIATGVDPMAVAAAIANGAKNLQAAVVAASKPLRSATVEFSLAPVASETEFDCALDVHGNLMICNNGPVIELPPASVAKLADYLAAIDVHAILSRAARATA